MSVPDDIAFTAAVKAEQERRGSRQHYAEKALTRPMREVVTPDLAAFLAELDHFYLATASAAGRPYIQHRGGPKGFLRVLDERHLGFADFAGNRQYITLANLKENPLAYLFLIHYPTRQRIKVWGRAAVIEDDPGLVAALSDPGYPGTPERAIRFRIEAWDINCRQHITPRYTEAEVALATGRLTARIAELEAEVARLRQRAGD